MHERLKGLRAEREKEERDSIARLLEQTEKKRRRFLQPRLAKDTLKTD